MYLETGTFKESLVGLASSPSLGLYSGDSVYRTLGLTTEFVVRCSLLIPR